MWRPFLTDTNEYLLNLTDVTDRPLWCTPRKTSILGFVITATSFMGIFDEFVSSKRLNYLLTYKCSQDHLEIFFCSVRSRNGWNNNPTPLQFCKTFRRLLLFTNITGEGGNCKVLCTTSMLSVSSGPKQKSTDVQQSVDMLVLKKYGLNILTEALADHDYDCLPNFIGLSEVAENVVAYIGGYVVRMVLKTFKCADCISSCIETRGSDLQFYRLLDKKNMGGLIKPSAGVVKICCYCELQIRKILQLTDNKLPSDEQFFKTFGIACAQRFYSAASILFPNLEDHALETAAIDEGHLYILIKQIINAYMRIRMFNLSKRLSYLAQGTSVRHVYTKLVLFSHQ